MNALSDNAKEGAFYGIRSKIAAILVAQNRGNPANKKFSTYNKEEKKLGLKL